MESWRNSLILARGSGSSFQPLMSSLSGTTIDRMEALISRNLKLLNRLSGENCNQKPSLASVLDCLGSEDMEKDKNEELETKLSQCL